MSTSLSPRILLVGAGAVGAIYGMALARGGAKVAFRIRPKYRAELTGGMTLFRHTLFGAPKVERFTDYELFDSDEALSGRTFDQVWLCTSSTALSADWLKPLAKVTGDATFVLLQPGPEDLERLAAVVARERIVRGYIPFISYQAPLEGQRLPEPGVGLAYLLPPGMTVPLSGPQARLTGVSEALLAGGVRTSEVPDVGPLLATGAALFMPLIAALELSDWSMKTLRRSKTFALGLGAARESLDIATAQAGAARPLFLPLLRPACLAPLVALAPMAFPFDLEVYLRYHFTKVGDQTLAMLDQVRSEGLRQGKSTGELETLIDALVVSRNRA